MLVGCQVVPVSENSFWRGMGRDRLLLYMVWETSADGAGLVKHRESFPDE